MTAAHEGGRLTIDLGAISDNWRDLSKRAAPSECAAVVKANAYGLGLEPVTRVLWQAGCRTFFVALPEEAFALRSALQDAAIYCLGGLTPGGAQDYVHHSVRPVLNTPGEVAEWADESAGAPAALHVDTGMTRLGLTPLEAQALAEDHAVRGRLNLDLIMSHLACGDTPDHPLNEQQIAAFGEIRTRFAGVAGSLANSAGTLQGARFRHDLARPGIALFGGQAVSTMANPMRHVITLDARILQVRRAQKGEMVGYGGTHTLTRDSRIAILGVGYADGYHRLIGRAPTASVSIAGRAAPLVGRISMDLIAVDVTDHPEGSVTPGSFARLIDEHRTIDDVARDAETIGYEVLTSLGHRYARTYVGPD